MTLRTLFAFAALGAGYLVVEQATRPAALDGTRADRDLARLIGAQTSADMGTVVTSPAGARSHDFRALVSTGDRLKSVYGRASADCTGADGVPGCWRIDYVEIDGKPARPTTDSGDLPIETADIGPRVPAGAAEKAPAAVLPMPGLPAAAPQAVPAGEDPSRASVASEAWRVASAAFRRRVPLPAPRPVERSMRAALTAELRPDLRVIIE